MSGARRVSVIVPVYNTRRYLSKCLDSLLAQTLDPECLEILVVDDGSTDGSGEMADEYAKKHGNLRVIHQDNAGSSAARNAGIDAAQGDYLGFVDSDDAVDPGMYEALVSFAEKTGVGMVQTGRDEIDEDGNALPFVVSIPDGDTFVTSEEMLFSLLLHEGDASFCTKLTARTLFDGREGAGEERLRFPEKELNEDFLLLIRMLERMDRLGTLSRRDYHVCYRTGSNSRRDADQQDFFPPVFTDIVVNADRAMQLVKEKHPGMLPAARRFALVQRLDYLLHIPVSMMRRDNVFYGDVVRYVRKNRAEIILNPYLSAKQRRNLWLLSLAPRLLRSLHGRIRRV
ncbi:MAG: glycosyltransferase [Lachnospiraceae bacterium]|nr:glycosyltransferase [Lachnospiraceae bacterium]